MSEAAFFDFDPAAELSAALGAVHQFLHLEAVEERGRRPRHRYEWRRSRCAAADRSDHRVGGRLGRRRRSDAREAAARSWVVRAALRRACGLRSSSANLPNLTGGSARRTRRARWRNRPPFQWPVHESQHDREVVVCVTAPITVESARRRCFTIVAGRPGYRTDIAEPPAQCVEIVRAGRAKHAAALGFVHQPVERGAIGSFKVDR